MSTLALASSRPVTRPLRRIPPATIAALGLVLFAVLTLPSAPGQAIDVTAADLGAGAPLPRGLAVAAALLCVAAGVSLWRGRRRSARSLSALAAAEGGFAALMLAPLPLVPVLVACGGAAMWLGLRPARGGVGHRQEDHDRAAELISQHGRNSLDPFMLREDKSLFFAAGGVVGYRLIGSTAVVAGDPVAPSGGGAAVIEEFARHARDKGWDLALTGVSELFASECRGLGLRAVCVGKEAVVDPSSFSLEGRAVRKVRQSVTRLGRLGWSTEVRTAHELDGEAREALRTIDETWKERQPRVQGFSMTLGRLWGADEDEQAVYVLAHDPDGELRGFLRFVPYGEGLSLDVMRRLGGEPNGLNEALVVEALRWAAKRGVREVSLNFAGFAHVMMPEPYELSPLQRGLRRALECCHERFQLERLARFNEKFSPIWRPRFLVCTSLSAVPRAGFAVLRAEAYVKPPRFTASPTGWRPTASPVHSAHAAGRPS